MTIIVSMKIMNMKTATEILLAKCTFYGWLLYEMLYFL